MLAVNMFEIVMPAYKIINTVSTYERQGGCIKVEPMEKVDKYE